MDPAHRAAKIAGGLAAATAGGAICAWLGTPLPWMLGSIAGMALAQMAGARLEVLPWWRDAGFVVVGIALGLYFTAPVVSQVASHWPWFILLGLAANAFGTLSAFVLTRLAGVNRATAYFGSMPGGASEMTVLGDRFGAAADRVAFAHSLRMLLVVTVFPVGITLAGFSLKDSYQPVAFEFHLAGFTVLVAIGIAAGLAAQRLRAPTAFMMGPLLATIAITSSGVVLSSMPAIWVNAAQVLLGAMLGARFERSFLAAAPRFVAAVAVSVSVTLVAAATVGWLISAGSGVYLGTTLLAAAPGGVAEMSITAKVLQVGVAYVTAAHVVRYMIVVLLTVPVFRLLAHLRPAR